MTESPENITASTETAATVPPSNGASDGGDTPASPKVKSKQNNWFREWGSALFYAFLAALIIRTFLFEPFRIPTSSMENNLLVGDFLVVSKLHYGARTPISICMPFTSWCLENVTLPFTHLPGFTAIQQGDVVVFNYPPETGAIDQKTHFIKRAMGLPGQTVELRDKTLFVNGEVIDLQPGMQQEWTVYTTGRVVLPPVRLRELGVHEKSRRSNRVIIEGPIEAIHEMRTWSYVERIQPLVRPNSLYTNTIFPRGSSNGRDNYGPITVPAKGATVELTSSNWPLYQAIITRFEGQDGHLAPDGTIRINGAPATTYTFAQDYYFVLGDNRDDSSDSRFFGLVPADHLVGKAVMIYFSWDERQEKWMQRPRFNRMFQLIH